MKHSAYILIVLCAAFSGCRKTTGPLVITTAAVSDIWPVKATCGGDVYFEGKNKVSEKGICWSTSPNPTTDNSKLSSGEGTGSFSAEMKDLQPGTVYYVRAYAKRLRCCLWRSAEICNAGASSVSFNNQ